MAALLEKLHTMKSVFKSHMYPLLLKCCPELLFRIQHYRMHRRIGDHWYLANLKSPKTFNEKILKSKLDERFRNLCTLVDKASAKEFVAKKIGSEHVIPTIGIYESASQVIIKDLPTPCIIKPTHASGRVIILRGDISDPTDNEVFQEMYRWQSVNHFLIGGEPQYRDIRPRIICEPLLGGGHTDLPDYKFFCFHGEPVCIQVDLDRHTCHTRRFYDCQWRSQPFTVRYPMAKRQVSCPKTLETMLQLSRQLAENFSFVRVDFYEVDEQVYFGELTFHPGSGSEPFSDYQADLLLGQYL
ncbi:ATP-grasp fold amidoligase family protein [Halomonas maura]|uniref:ATP-grasp fold amidoligase family protein n=1 Tax=Halomonas maura TaxID=117606 RepID=UPI0025B57778|nr:ATP-grasp fold amidoligase family protein [Halomonas maura]MDN3555228.1 ATP-grasp fold amidoligase family protein [Halomonas maura]